MILPTHITATGFAGTTTAALVVEDEPALVGQAKKLWQQVVEVRPGSTVQDENGGRRVGAVRAPVQRHGRGRCVTRSVGWGRWGWRHISVVARHQAGRID